MRKNNEADDARKRRRQTQEQDRRGSLFRNNTALHWTLVSCVLLYTVATLRVTTLMHCSQRKITTVPLDRLHQHTPKEGAPAVQPLTTETASATHLRDLIQRDPWTPKDSPLVSFHEPLLALPRIAVNANTVVFILSKYEHFDRRQAIRTTWANPSRHNAYFVIGQPPKNCSQISADCGSGGEHYRNRSLIEQRLREEQAANLDLVEIPMDETYRTLPEKLIQAYDWAIYHFPSVQWLVKADDDMYCRIDALETYLQRYNSDQHILLGDMQVGSEVWSTGKWAEKEYNASEYPLFPLGSAGHVISQQTARHLVQHVSQLHRYQGEDTSLGIWIDELNLTDRIYINTHSMFRTMNGVGTSACGKKDAYMVGHNFTVAEILECHELFTNDQALSGGSMLWTERPTGFNPVHIDVSKPMFRKSRRKDRKLHQDGVERTCWILLVAAMLMYYNRKNGAACGTLRYPMYIVVTIVVIHLAAPRDELQPKHNGPPRLYVCGWTVTAAGAEHVATIFPGHEYIPLYDSPPTESRREDVLVTSESYGPQCSRVWNGRGSFARWALSFRGKIVQRNGENHTMDAIEGRPGHIYELGFMRDDTEHMRFRYVQTVLLEYGPKVWKTVFDPENKPKSKGTKFLIYAQQQCHEHRESAFDHFSEIDVVDFGGSCSGRGKNPSRIRKATDVVSTTNAVWTENSELFASYRFCLVMENTFPAMEGYITEKILNAFLAGCIPIYWGPPEVFKIFNKNSFVFYDVENPEPALEEVRLLQTNQRAYEAKQTEPILAHGNVTIEEYFSFTTEYGEGQLAQRLHQFLDLPFPARHGS